MFNDSLNQAKHCFAELLGPTESLQALKKNLDKIEQEIIQTNKEQQGPKSSI
jgi:23S rRNA A1618 N6-methylase RlmF